MDHQAYSLQSPEYLAKEYAGNKQKLAQAAQMGLVDGTAAVMAGMFIDRMRKAAFEEQAPPQQTVAQQVFAPPQPAAPPPPMPQAPMGAPQGGPPQGGMGAPPPQGGMAPPPPQGGPPGMAAGGLTSLAIPDQMFNGPGAGAESFAGGGIVSFAGGGLNLLGDEEEGDLQDRLIKRQWELRAEQDARDNGGSDAAARRRSQALVGGFRGNSGDAPTAPRSAMPTNPTAPRGKISQAEVGILRAKDRSFGGAPGSSRDFPIKLTTANRDSIAPGQYYEDRYGKVFVNGPKASAAPASSAPASAGTRGLGALAAKSSVAAPGTVAPPGGLAAALKGAGNMEDALREARGMVADPRQGAAYKEQAAELASRRSPEARKARKKEDVWATLAEIGLGIAAGKSSNWLENVSAGAAAALPNINARNKERRMEARQDLKDAVEQDFAGYNIDIKNAEVAAKLLRDKQEALVQGYTLAQAERLAIAQMKNVTENTKLQIEGSRQNALIGAGASRYAADKLSDPRSFVENMAAKYRSQGYSPVDANDQATRDYMDLKSTQTGVPPEVTAARNKLNPSPARGSVVNYGSLR